MRCNCFDGRELATTIVCCSSLSFTARGVRGLLPLPLLPPLVDVVAVRPEEAADTSFKTWALAAGVKANDEVLAMGYKTGMGTRIERDVSPPLKLPLLLHERRGVSPSGGTGGVVAASVVSSEAEPAVLAPAASMLRSEALDDLVNNNDSEIRDDVRVRRLGVVPL